jgi:membrane protein YqaA with SNARE-associated domain
LAIRLFGATVGETIDYILGTTAGPRKPKEEEKQRKATTKLLNDRQLIWARPTLSVLAIIGGTFMLLSGSSQAQQAGAGFIGLVRGYWLP